MPMLDFNKVIALPGLGDSLNAFGVLPGPGAAAQRFTEAPNIVLFTHRPFTFRVNCSCTLIIMCVHPVRYTIWHS